MRKIFFFCSVLALGASKPNGYYHQQYSYKSSSASFKNNELQHKNEDQGFYSKDGDLEGRLTPKVNSQSQHSEYVNPKLVGGSAGYQAAGYTGAGGSDYLAGSHYGSNGVQTAGAVDGYASSDRVLDLSNIYNTRGYSTHQGYGANQGYGTSQGNYGALHSGGYGGGSSNYGYAQGGSGYGYVQHGTSQGTSGSYGTNANLNALMQRLQDDMTRQLEHAIYKQYQTSGYSASVSNSQMNTDIGLLEEELKRNLTRQLQDSLRTQYGSNTYTVVEGRPSTAPNYSNQELAALTRRLENDLISKLHQSVRTTYNRESSNTYTSSGNTYRPVVVYPATTSRPYYERPATGASNVIVYGPVPTRQTIVSYPDKLMVQTPNVRYTPIPNPESLTQIASRTQADINSYLDTALQTLYTTYLQTDRTSSYTVTDFDNEVNRIKDEILRKLAYNMEDEIRKNYGQQVLKNEYYYSISSNGDISTQSNYNQRDLENLKKQVEENLLRKLNQTTNTYRDQYTQRQQSQYSSNTYTVTYRPTYYTSGNQRYDYSDLQRQLSQQVQNALNQHRYSQSSSYSSSASSNPQAYQTSLDELSRELQRNLTEQLSNYRAQTSSSSSSSYGYMSGSSGGSADFEAMKNQLQNQLMQQLRQGLQNQHHYSASASYSASSSSSANANYGMHQAYGSYPSTCLHGCTTRRKRDLNNYFSGKRHGVKTMRFFRRSEASNGETPLSSARYLHHPEELSYPSHHGMQFSGQSSYSNHFQSTYSRKHETRNEEIEPEIVEDLDITNHATHGTPKVNKQPSEQLEDSLQQQLEPITTTYRKTLKYVDQNELEQQQSQDSLAQPLQKIQDDLTQQLVLGHKTTQEILANSGKLRDQNDLSQQLELPHHHDQELEGQLTLDQQTLGQQIEDQNTIGHLHISKHDDQNLESQLNLEQQTFGQRDQNIIGHLHRPNHHNEELEGQLTLGQQQIPGQQLESQDLISYSPKHHDQNLESQLTLGQQVEDQNILGHLHKPNYHNTNLQVQQIGYSQNQQDLTQQLELDDINKPKLLKQLADQNTVGQFNKPKMNRPIDDQNEEDLTQQLELEDTHKQGREPLFNQQNMVGQYNKRYNLNVQQKTEDDQNEQDLTQQLELEDTHKPQLVQVQKLEEIPTQQLELGSIHKPKVSDQQQEWEEPTQYPKKPFGDYEQQQSNADLQEQSQDQQLSDLTQQLSFTLPRNVKPKPASDQQLELEPVQKPQQVESEDDLQQLELEGRPKYKLPKQSQETQQIEDDLTQQLEISNSKYKKPEADQQLQSQDDFDQNLEIYGGPERKPEALDQTGMDSQIVLQTIPKRKFGGDLTQQVEDSNLVLEGVPSTSRRVTGIPDQQLTIDDQKLQRTNANSLTPVRIEGQTLADQKSEEPEVKLELYDSNGSSNKRTTITPQQTAVNQQEEEDLNQQLELTDLQNPVDQEGLQLEHDQLELTEARTTKPDLEYSPNLVSPESELSFLPATSDSSQTSSVQSEKTTRHHYQYSSTGQNVVTQVSQRRHPAQGYGSNELADQRPFTNGHSAGTTNPTSWSQSSMNSYENALKQQEALMDLLKKKVQKAHASNQELYGHRTIKKTVFVDGKAVSTQESSQLIKPNGEVVELQASPLETTFTRNIYPGQLGHHTSSQHNVNTQSTGYSGNKLRSTYHVTGNPGNTQWFSNGGTFEQNPLSHFGSDLYSKGFEGQSEFSGKTTRRVVHYVNGKPVSASEKIQILQPNGQIIERQHDLPPRELSSISHSLSSADFGHNIHGLNIPQTYIGSQNSAVSRHTFKKSARYVNGKLVDFSSSSQDVEPKGQISEYETGLPHTVELADNFNMTPLKHSTGNYHTSGTKTSRYFEGRGY